MYHSRKNVQWAYKGRGIGNCAVKEYGFKAAVQNRQFSTLMVLNSRKIGVLSVCKWYHSTNMLGLKSSSVRAFSQ